MYAACMVALQIRDVPKEIHDALAKQAAKQGQSLQAYLLGVLEREVGFIRNLEILYEAEHEAPEGGWETTPEEHDRFWAEVRAERDGDAPGPDDQAS